MVPDALPTDIAALAPAEEGASDGAAPKRNRTRRPLPATVATTNAHSVGGQFVVHIDALHGNPYDGHTLKAAVEGAEAWTGVTVKRIYVDKGYRGHGLDRFKVWRSGNKAPTEATRRELCRRSAIEPVIGHMKTDGLLDRNVLKGKDGDRINAILSGAGHNFRLLLRWLRLLLSLILETIWAIIHAAPRTTACIRRGKVAAPYGAATRSDR